jgi:hypothetical protein
VGNPLARPVTRQLEHRTLGGHRLNGHCPEFHRLLHDPVHLVTAGQGLHQGDSQGRLLLDRQARPEPRQGLFAEGRQSGGKLATTTIEEHHRIADSQIAGPRSAWCATGAGRRQFHSQEQAPRGRRSADSSCYYRDQNHVTQRD